MRPADYEMVIGLEVHVELETRRKLFCSCPTAFGARPNTQCCPVCMGAPGALPVLNEQAVRLAVKAGVAAGCRVAPVSGLDRKHYFYPDLPKAYQISQYFQPLCARGHLDIESEDGGRKRIGVTRIHIEEDAGRLVREEGKGASIDFNRCGVPLIEIVSEPDIRSASEAIAYLRKLRAVLLYTGVSDCRMNEGSLRCDVNLSVRRKGESALGTRTETKNLNSFQFVGKAIEYEFARQVRAVQAGEAIEQETRRFDSGTGKTLRMRRKEDARDYRFFPDPDLPPIVVSEQMLAAVSAEIPALPDARMRAYTERFGLTAYTAEQLCSQRWTADYFEDAASRTDYPQLAANLILGEIFRLMPPGSAEIRICPAHLAALAQMLGRGEIGSAAGREVAAALWERDTDPRAYVESRALRQISDEGALASIARAVLEEQVKMAEDYRRGKTAAMKALVGRAMHKSGGRGNPVKIREILERLLAEKE